MLSHMLVLLESKNFTSGLAILAPPTIPINHYFGSRNQQNRETRATRSMLLRLRQQKRLEVQSGHINIAMPEHIRGAEALSYYSMLNYSTTIMPALNTLIFSK